MYENCISFAIVPKFEPKTEKSTVAWEDKIRVKSPDLMPGEPLNEDAMSKDPCEDHSLDEIVRKMGIDVEFLPELCRADIHRIHKTVEGFTTKGEVIAAVEPSCISHVLLAGATSFIGQFLLLALLQVQQGLTVTCTVPEDKGSTSMQETILWSMVKRFVANGSVRLVSCDLTKVQDTASDLWDELSASVDAVLLFPDDSDKIPGNYEDIHERDTQSLLSVIELCVTKRLKHLGYGSSMNVFPAYTARFRGKYSDTPLSESPSVIDMLGLFPLNVMSHPWSMLVGEVGVSAAARHGVPTYIYRLPMFGCSIDGICNENNVFVRLRSAMQQVNMYPIEFPEEHVGFEEPADIVACIVANSLMNRSDLQQSACTEGMYSMQPVVFNCVRQDKVTVLHGKMEKGPLLRTPDSYTANLMCGFNPTVCSWLEFKECCLNLGQESPLHGYWALIDHMETFWFASECKANRAPPQPHINTASCGDVRWIDPWRLALGAIAWQQFGSMSSRWSLPKFTPNIDIDDMFDTASKLCGVPPEDVLDKDSEVVLRKMVQCGDISMYTTIFFQRAWLQSYMEINHHVKTSHSTKNNVKPRQDPIIICGFNRTGTTFMHRALSTDPQFRALRMGTMLNFPYFDGRNNWLFLQSAYRSLMQAGTTGPGSAKDREKRHEHFFDFDNPEEDCFFLFSCFRSFAYRFKLNVDFSFLEWLLEDGNMTSTIDFHSKYLAMMEAANEADSSRRWLLKHPYHTLGLHEILSYYPKASFIWIHRDPRDILPSNLLLDDQLYTLEGLRWSSEQARVDWVRSKSLPAYKQMIDRGVKFRRENKDTKFVDVSYKEFTENPLTVVKYIYEQLNLDLLPEIELQVAEDLSVKQAKHNKQTPPPNPYLNHPQIEEDVKQLYAEYLKLCSELGFDFNADVF